MSRVEGMAAIASKRLAAQAELQQLIAGTGSLLAAGTSLGEQAIAVCYTRSGDRTTHTQEFYPEGFYDLEKVAKMLQIHQTFGGKCMYEMFCDAAGGIPPVLEPGVPVEGLPIITGHGAAILADADYVYVGIDVSRGYIIIRKSDWSLVEDLPSLHGKCTGIHIDADYLYLGVWSSTDGYPIAILDRSTWTFAGTMPYIGGRAWGGSVDAHVDDEYIYTTLANGIGYMIVRKSDRSLVSGLPAMPGRCNRVFSDKDYVYLAHYYGNGYTVMRKSDWGIVENTPALPNSSVGWAEFTEAYADDQFLYVSHKGGKCFTVINKADWTILEDTPAIIAGAGLGIYADDRFVYVIHTGSDGYSVIRKSNWTALENIVPIRHTPTSDSTAEIYADDTYIYMAHRGAGGYSIVAQYI